MNRIAIFGNLGGGKSTLADRLGEALDLPVIHLDPRHDQACWEALGEDELEFEHDQLLLTGGWVIEGFGTWWMIERRLAAADTVIVIDLPILLHIDRALRRQTRARAAQPAGVRPCVWSHVTDACGLIRKIRDVHRHTLPRLRALLASAGPRLHPIRLTSQRAIDTFLADASVAVA